MIGLDTTAIIDIFKNEPNIKKVIEKSNEPFAATIMSHQEIFFGLDLKDQLYINEEKYYDEFFNKIFLFPLDLFSSKRAAEIFWRLKKEKKEIGRFDCMIAGIFLTNEVNQIITKNVKHFSQIKELKIISY
ncbi:PIN domain-containing protein [Candidatus Pacearchaeota archaeon]|nr:PIN domain-containing protein [Candidatus Pacearchaeota archaeon]